MTVVTPLFAGVLALLYVFLSINIVRHRLTKRTSLGAGDSREMEYAIRAHGNFIEYVPLSLLLMWFLETLTLSAAEPFWLGVILVVARVAHAFGMFYPKQLMIMRQLGTVATFGVIVKASIEILQHYLPLTI